MNNIKHQINQAARIARINIRASGMHAKHSDDYSEIDFVLHGERKTVTLTHSYAGELIKKDELDSFLTEAAEALYAHSKNKTHESN